MIVNLEARELFRLAGVRGATLEALDGRLWVTEDGCEADACLEPGERYRVRGNGLVLVGVDESGGAATARLAVRPATAAGAAGLLHHLGFKRLPGWMV